MSNRYQITKKVTIVGMIINCLLAMIKMLIGAIGRSPALFADGVHSFSDLISDIMVLFAAKYANIGEDKNHPYGHERIETLATLVLSAILITVGFTIVYHSLSNLIIGSYSTPDKFTIFAAIFSILGNEFIYQYTMKAANEIDSDLLRANAWHSRSDMWSSVVVLIGLIGAFIGFVWMDAIAALVVCYMVVKMGIKWGYSAVSELIDEGVDEETRVSIKKIIRDTEGVLDFHCLRSRKMAGKIIIDVHILVDKYITASEGHYIAEKVRSNIYYNIENIKDITVHVDVTDHYDVFVKLDKAEPSRKEIIEQLKHYCSSTYLNIDLLLEKKMFLYYLESHIEIYLFLKDEKLLEEYQHKLSNFKIKNHNIEVTVFAYV
ncbi:cation diffusion facilitator family transporter [Francisella frigiditurris]|uniref:Cation diffusion facilitator transporter family protein n=1 Tax=Francisella frigiditurris TaxID=1542390 RepID=A0A1J0KSQ5_9GAMM|nr:cation diffusion facilitator family transporter [Francisella frigiditurris]APC96660.1 cation diffusion facilitator transporter family protein [Francisella frigiditurris]